MLPLRFARQWRIADVLVLLSMLIVALMPAVWFWSDDQALDTWFVDVDKWMHGIAFAALAVWFAGQYRAGFYWRIGLGLLLFGALIEVCQGWISYRSAEWFDIAADAAGIIIGLTFATAGLGGWSLRVEGWLARRSAGATID